ncbi:hypothetical protein QUB70_06635 [Microcoleus sp. A003_D6]|uniref:hypothetical protein n=1 Tax=Microcoleus sp. A003_D6 TaxID=3055266 RepID=UPI002FD07654
MGFRNRVFYENTSLHPADSEKNPVSLVGVRKSWFTEKFILANCYNPQVAGNILAGKSQCQVSETQTPHDFVDFDSLTILNKNLEPL